MKKKILWVILSAIILVVVFIILKPESSKAPSPGGSTQQQTKTFSFEVKDGQIVAGEQTIRLNQGDKVKLTVTSSTPDELHLHGYNKEIELKANKPSSLSFDANLTGRFELELHRSEKVIAALEVQPKQ